MPYIAAHWVNQAQAHYQTAVSFIAIMLTLCQATSGDCGHHSYCPQNSGM